MKPKAQQATPAFLNFRRCCSLLLLFAAVAVAGCASLERLPGAKLEQCQQIKILGLSQARFYVDDIDKIHDIALKAYKRRNLARPGGKTVNFLAVSGGGDDGAFGAGLLAGWSEHGGRPEFDVVTGVSTGALAAPFAYLGRAYDPQLTAVYTDVTSDDILRQRGFVLGVLASDAMADSAPLRDMIGRHIDDRMIQAIAQEYQKGRLLLILTTNLDQGRPVIWNIGEIAASNDPGARKMIIDVLLASASIPGAFPPVMIDVTVDGQKYQEMHVDGGTIAQAFLYPPSYSLNDAALRRGVKLAALRSERKRVAYVIRNGRLRRNEEEVKLQTIAIAKQAITTMIASSGVNDTYRMYLVSRRDGVDFNLASIDEDFAAPYKGPFDQDYMRSLFDYGYEEGALATLAETYPPHALRDAK
jgi:Patatin-like phospholipase